MLATSCALRIHGHDSGPELFEAIRQGTASVVEHRGRITSYATMIGFFGHVVGESNDELKALIGVAQSFPGPGFLLPPRNGEMFRWCTEQGLRIVQPMTLMSVGLCNEPRGRLYLRSSTDPSLLRLVRRPLPAGDSQGL